MADSKKITRPGKLQPGDAVGVVAPAGPVDSDFLDKGIKVIKRMGFKPALGKYVQSRNGFLAGTDKDRAADLMDMFINPEIKAVFCARGGYGVNRVLPRLKPDVIRKNPKILVGASDITLLLLYLNQRCSQVAFHGPMVAGNFGRHPMKKTRKQFQDILTGQSQGKLLVSPRAKVLQPGVAQGQVTGGCLTLLCRSLKTPCEIQTRNKILLIEDVNEPPYKIDGMLWQLKAAGKFRGIKGIILGEMVNCGLAKGKKDSLDTVYKEVFDGLSIPIVRNFPIGHGREMWTVPFGVDATLDAESKSLHFEHCGVE